MKRVLMVAYHFPPLAGSSGIQRTLRFAQQLPDFGWEPIVLTAHTRAYQSISDDLLREVPTNLVVYRAFALDTTRHLSIAGRYPGFLARPDRWMSWRWSAVVAGMRLIQRYQPAVLWSTYPIATAHQIGAILNRRSGLPWIADFRDPMAQEGYPSDSKTWKHYKKIEEVAFRNASFSVFTTPSALQAYRSRYSEVPAERSVLIENGYDEDSFAGLEFSLAVKGPLNPGKITLLHSGVVYPYERNPTQLFRAIRALQDSGQVGATEFILRLRAAGHDAWLRSLATEHGITKFIDLAPPLPYREALEEMLRADGLVVLQADNCNAQIPAKLYEYLRCRRPILGLTDPAGDTAWTLRNAGVQYIARLESFEDIMSILSRFLKELRDQKVQSLIDASIQAASRIRRTGQLAELLNSLLLRY